MCFINIWLTCLMFIMPHLSILNNGKNTYIKNPLHVNVHSDVVKHNFMPRMHGTVFWFSIAKVFIFSRLKNAMHRLKSLAFSVRAVL